MANWLGALLPLILALCAASASDESFVNVDCGTSGDTMDEQYKKWVGDERYVQSGQSAVVNKTYNYPISQLRSLRYFPSEKKSCYTFPSIGTGNKILVRAWFYYGNYDDLSSPPKFDLLFDGNRWATVITDMSTDQMHEMIYITKSDDVSICLARTNLSSVPFINSLEIKKLNQGMYIGMDTNRPLYVKGRYAYGWEWRRYPYDTYDRFWTPFTDYEKFGLKPLNGSSYPTIDLADAPPAAVMMQGVTTSSNQSSDLTIPIPVLSTTPIPHYVTFYFVELSPDATRSFTILLDNQRFNPYTIVPYQAFNFYTIVPNGKVQEFSRPNISLSNNSVFRLEKASRFTLPPLISAAEFYEIGDAWVVAATESSDVKALSELQKSYLQLRNWSGDPCLPFGYAWEWVNCSTESPPRVTALYLSGYGLTGGLVDFSDLTALQTIDLHNNSLSGSVPEFLRHLPNLKDLNLADNQFSGSLPASLTGNSMINLNISGNNISNSSDTANSTETKPNVGKKNNVGVVAGATIGSLLFLLLLVMIAFFLFKKRTGNAVRLDPSVDNAKKKSILRQRKVNHGFSYAEIVEITQNFEKAIGEGGSGNVYYGQLENDSEVAVKVLKNSLPRGTKDFVAEAELLMTVHHRCLVSFVGYCEEGGNLILLYEYMSGGNLRQLLSGRTSTHAFLTWERRLQVALSVATGLDYLHSGCNPSIIHRDVKTTNILLNGKMEAKVADFGLSKAGQKDDVTHLSTVVAGTPGYIDPEYYNTNLVTRKSDVYSFGVVLFELITGHPPFFDVSGERFHIVQWATGRLSRGDIHGVADPKLRGQYNVDSMRKVADTAMSCTSQSSHSRPHMSNVVDQLKEAMEAGNCYQRRTDTSFIEVQNSSSSSYDNSSSVPSASFLPTSR